MAETSVHGAISRGSSGDRPTRTDPDQPPPPPPSRRSGSPSDLVSALPDAVIHRIFSFLPLEDVVKTSALSRRWRSTWTSATDLVFDGDIEGRPRGTLAFSFLVDGVLDQCTSPSVKRFHVTGFRYDKPYQPKVDLWLRFAVRRRVEDLRLWLTNHSPIFYLLPGILYSLSWLVRLDVRSCRFSLGRAVRWPRLKVLSIRNAELSDDFLGRIFRGCPVLESLELHGCWGVENIVIDSTSVKELVLVHGTFSNPKKIWAPHLLLLRVLGRRHHLNLIRLRLDDISSLVEAELDFDIVTLDKWMCCELLEETFEKLHRVPTITIGAWCLEILSLLEMKGVPSPLSKCQNLTLHGPVSQWDLPGIAYMLRSSPCLEKLVILLTDLPPLMFMLDEGCFNFDEEDFLCSRKGNFQCLAKHLKRVEIIGPEADSFGSKHLLALIKFLLGDALVLEKLIIKAKLPTRHGQKGFEAAVLSKLFGVSKNVLSCRRASKHAEVIFDCPSE
ncbi:F-box protein At5g03100-like isoform X1 [Syzygium oleosum]|uniref:F-box protein At5g03100-like isoform X1 n=1 Tax=Syzygium oleosum TaxID=219896 RepID=UPI0024BA3132|nr:F-box protein At5g03100-like isoform X1 [Syzygium oleosum]